MDREFATISCEDAKLGRVHDWASIVIPRAGLTDESGRDEDNRGNIAGSKNGLGKFEHTGVGIVKRHEDRTSRQRLVKHLMEGNEMEFLLAQPTQLLLELGDAHNVLGLRRGSDLMIHKNPQTTAEEPTHSIKDLNDSPIDNKIIPEPDHIV